MTKKDKLDSLAWVGIILGGIIRSLPKTWWPHSWLIKCAREREERSRRWLATPPPKFGELSDEAYLRAGRKDGDVFH